MRSMRPRGGIRAVVSPILLVLLLATSASAQRGQRDPAIEFVSLFMAACFATQASAEKVEAFATSRGYAPVAAPMAASLLDGDAGKVWSAERDGPGLFLARRDGGRCSAHGRGIPPDRLAQALSIMMLAHVQMSGRAPAAPQIEKRDDGKTLVSWLFTLPGAKKMAIVAVTRTEPTASAETVLTASPVNE